METIFAEMQDHLQRVAQDPSVPLNSRILEKLDSSIIGDLPTLRKRMLANQLASLLPTLQQDPTPAAELAAALIDSDDSLSFSDVLGLKPEVNFVGGLRAPVPALNKLTLALLQKAESAADAGLVAGKPEIVSALIDLWLRTSNTTVAEKARVVVGGLLAAEPPDAHDGEGPPNPASQGLMWRRVFNDKDVYNLIYSLTSVSTVGQPDQLSKREKTIAQARLLDLLQDIHDAPQIWRSQIPEVEQVYGVEPGNGLLDFAIAKMTDYKDDVLIHMTLIDFFTRLVAQSNGDMLTLNSTRSAEVSPNSSKTLDFLISKGVHMRTLSYFLSSETHDPLDVTYLYSSATHYVATYARHYTTHFLETTAKDVIARLTEVLGRVLPNAWAGSSFAASHDLKLLSSLPQRALLSIDKGALLMAIPTRPINVDALHALGSVFRGPMSPSNAEDMEIIVPPPTSPSQATPDLTASDRVASRALFLLYVQANPTFFRDLITAAETVTVKDHALAAVSLLQAIVDSSWDPLPESPTALFPSEKQLENQCSIYRTPLPSQGSLAILQPPAIQLVMPFLMRGPENQTEAGWEVAVAKHSVVGGLKRGLGAVIDKGELEESEHWKEIWLAIERRDNEGPTGRRDGDGGLAGRGIPNVATLGH